MSVSNHSRNMEPLEKPEKSKTGFLDLSAELRNRVYDLALVHNDEYDEGFVNLDYYLDDCYLDDADERPDLVFGLLAVSRQIYLEAAPILYGANRFQVSFEHHRWLTRIGGNVVYLRDLRLKLSFESVEKKSIDSFRTQFRSCLTKVEQAPKLYLLKLELGWARPIWAQILMDRLRREVEGMFLPVPQMIDDESGLCEYNHDVPLVSIEQGISGGEIYCRKLRSDVGLGGGVPDADWEKREESRIRRSLYRHW